MNPIEAIADAIMTFEGWNAGSRSNRNRNPGNLRPYKATQPRDAGGYRVFGTLAEGYEALCADLRHKCSGSARLPEGSTATLRKLFEVYAPIGDSNRPADYARYVAARVSVALGQAVTANTTLGEILHPPIVPVGAEAPAAPPAAAVPIKPSKATP